jgi:ribosomal protein S27AE
MTSCGVTEQVLKSPNFCDSCFFLHFTRFFEFVCTLCNGKDEECIRRLDLSLVDSVHLALFNLILSKNQKFHDLETSILPFMKKKIKYLQGSPNNPLFKASKVEPECISLLLAANKSRFMCGSETGKKSSYWGLRKMCPPPLPGKYLNISHQFGRWAGGRRSRKAIVAAVRSRSSCNIDIRRFPAKKGTGNLPQMRRNRGRCKDPVADHSDSDASGKCTLDFLIKTPKDFSGANNPFRSVGPAAETGSGSSRCGGDITPGGSLRRLLSSDKGSPSSSGAPSTVTTDGRLYHASNLRNCNF